LFTDLESSLTNSLPTFRRQCSWWTRTGRSFSTTTRPRPSSGKHSRRSDRSHRSRAQRSSLPESRGCAFRLDELPLADRGAAAAARTWQYVDTEARRCAPQAHGHGHPTAWAREHVGRGTDLLGKRSEPALAIRSGWVQTASYRARRSIQAGRRF